MTYKDVHGKKFVIVGGGTAGAIAALYLHAVDYECDITLVKSDEVGIIGAGEGTTPTFLQMIDTLGIPLDRLVKNTGATIKHGIRFSGWTRDNKQPSDRYMHSFGAGGGLGVTDLTSGNQIIPITGGFLMNSYYGESPDKSDLTAKAAKLRKVNFAPKDGTSIADSKEIHDKITDFLSLSPFAVHFDAHALAQELLDIAVERGINIIEGKIESFNQDDEGNVTELLLEDGQTVETDLIIDASGFAKIFPKAFKSDWVSLKEYLPTDSAIPFFLPAEKKLPAYTDAIAMDYGWMWKIPLQHRYGCGYVFDSSLTTAEEAAKEAEEFLGQSVEYDRVLKFEPGYYKDPWRYNVISIGLSSGFVEPLEATSIWSTIIQLQYLLTRPETLHKATSEYKEYYNHRVSRLQSSIASMIQFHYLTKRNDTDFWKKFNRENAMPELAKLLDIMDYRTIDFEDVSPPFALDSWYYVGMGNKYKPLMESLNRAEEHNVYPMEIKNEYEYLRKIQSQVAVNNLYDHRYFLEKMGAPPWED